MTAATTREEYGELFSLYLPVGLVVLALVVGFLAVSLVRDRASRGSRPSKRESSPRLEGAFIVLLAVVTALLLWRTLDGLYDLGAGSGQAQASGPPAVTIDVVAAKWNWRFAYPGGVVQQGAGPDSFAVLVVPAGRPVRFRLTSLDVVHSFWIPEARYKMDAYPDRTNVFDLTFERGVQYDSARCSEFCGVYHDQMRFGVDVRSPEAFAAWLASRRRKAAA